MKSYKSQTVNGGTTIILDSVQEAVERATGYDLNKIFTITGMSEHHKQQYVSEYKRGLDECCTAIVKGDKEFKKKVDEIIDDVLPLVDEICPLFCQDHQGYKRSEEGITTTPDLVASGEQLCTFAKKETPFKLKKGKGEGAYRLIINTDVSWWGEPEMNCAMVGALVLILQRYAPVEIWIQQGWIHWSKEGRQQNVDKQGITLFKLNYEGAWDVTNIAFWICHPGKDSPFSFIVNRALGRIYNCTSCNAELEADLMLRGDWQTLYGFSRYKELLYTEQLDMIAKYISDTGMKVLVEDAEKWNIKLDPNTGEPL
jgi:hypothetical protein